MINVKSATPIMGIIIYNNISGIPSIVYDAGGIITGSIFL
jgi:hypothetical protein